MLSKDLMWKGIIEDYFPEFLHFFFKNWTHRIDFDKGFEFLDKELEKLFPTSEETRRYADKLIKVFSNVGEELWFLIHVEIQGYVDKDFAERMFIYYYRIFDRYRRSVTALAIFTDDHRTYHPHYYEQYFMNSYLRYKFDTYKVLNQKQQDFNVLPDNLFSIILENVWVDLQRWPEEEKMVARLRLARRLLKLGHTRAKIARLINFIRYYGHFEKSENSLKFEKNFIQLTEKPGPMGINEYLMEAMAEKAEKEGHERGLEEGIELSIRKVLSKGFSVEETADLLDVPLEQVKKIAEEQGN